MVKASKSIEWSAFVILNLAILAIGLNAQTVTTAAGGFTGDGRKAINASLGFPEGIVVDQAGNLYIADIFLHRVRKVDALGVISTFVGTGICGFSGDNGLASAAKVCFPTGVALGPAGALFFADQGNFRIRRISSGVVATFAGNGSAAFSGDNGPAIQAGMNPWAVAFDGAGNLYFSDIGNERIRRIDSFGIITTVAGNGTAGYNGDNISATGASLNSPRGVLVDWAGNLYIADTLNHRVRVVNTSGMITTLAGNGADGVTGDSGPAADAAVGSPRFLALDANGNLLISGNNRVRRVALNSPSKTITTVAGSSFGFNGDGQSPLNTQFAGNSGLVFDQAGNLLFADVGNSRIRKISQVVTTVAGGYIGDSSSATSASVNEPEDVVLDSAGDLYIADSANNRIRKVNTAGTITTVAGNGFSGSTGDNGPATAAQISFPQAVAVDTLGNVFISDSSGSIRKVDSAGMISTYLSNVSAARMAVDSNNNLYFVDPANCVVQQVTPAGEAMTIAGVRATCGFNGDEILATSAYLNAPAGVAVDSTGNVYIGDSRNNRVRKVDSSGMISTIAGNGSCGFSGDKGLAISATLCHPAGVAIHNGNIIVADENNLRIRQIKGGIISTLAGSGRPGFNGNGLSATQANLDDPVAVAIDSVGNIFVADDASYRIRKVSVPVADLAVTNVASTSATLPGSTLTYTITIKNNGPNSASNVQMSDPLPVGTTFSSFTVSPLPGTACAAPAGGSNAVSCHVPTLANGGSLTLQLTVQITAPAGSTISDTATVNSTTLDPNTSNNTGIATTNVN